MRASLIPQADGFAIPAAKLEGASLPPLGQESAPLLGGLLDPCRRGQICDRAPDKRRGLKAQDPSNARGRCDVPSVVVGDQHELVGLRRKRRILIFRPRCDNLKRGCPDFIRCSGSLPAAFGAPPLLEKIADRSRRHGGSSLTGDAAGAVIMPDTLLQAGRAGPVDRAGWLTRDRSIMKTNHDIDDAIHLAAERTTTAQAVVSESIDAGARPAIEDVETVVQRAEDTDLLAQQAADGDVERTSSVGAPRDRPTAGVVLRRAATSDGFCVTGAR